MFNLFPAYIGTGATVTYIADDYKELKLKIPLNWRTRNYVGTIYGGSIYGAVDPMYMLMLMKILGPDYVVWDKAATIRFKKPGTSTIYADFIITNEIVEDILNRVHELGEVDQHFKLNITDKAGKVCAEVDKIIYIARKDHYKKKLVSRNINN